MGLRSYVQHARINIQTLKTRGLAVLAIGAGAVAALALIAPAAAFGPHMRYVGHTAVGTNKSCASPGYTSVQSAVDAANTGDTVYLCGGQFAEQVFVNKSVTLTGDAGSGLTATGATFSADDADYPAKFAADNLFLPQALLVTTGDDVAVNNLRISGPFTNTHACAQNDYGVLALDGKVTLEGDTIADVADVSSSLYGCQFGVGVQVGRTYWPSADFASSPVENFTAKAYLNNVTVTGYQKNGITADGVGSKLFVEHSLVVGGGAAAPFGTIIAQNGMQVSRGATGTVEDNTVADNAYSGSGYATAAGVLIYGGWGDPLSKDVTVQGNKLIDNDVAVDFVNYSSDGTGPAATATKNSASGNWIFSASVTNTTGLCNGGAACGGQNIGYQAGVQDIGNKDSACYNTIVGPGYTEEGSYDYSVTPPVFTQTGADTALVRTIDAGDTFPTTNFSSCSYMHVGNGHYGNSFFNFYHGKFGHWFYR
ncbi:MAG TPA: hypothetical protein VHC98_01005 [Candidatus Saccharimonadales bacterium]|nr:hypothetical protein [Candidatus Saccharimonadales bacterium]